MRALGFVLALVLAGPVHAQETTTYSYDALGRLTATQVNNGPNSGTTTTLEYDPAGNRKRYTVAGAPPPRSTTGSLRVIVVPLNGYTVIPLPNTGF